MKTRNFENFLKSIPLDKYRDELMKYKLVEQDLPKDLIPLSDIFKYYWKEGKTAEFPNYDEFFEIWWKEHLLPLDAFKRQYFWGCSHDFVFNGFKARIYRTLISVLTQFHFMYLWLENCELPLTVGWELDIKGIDGLVNNNNENIILSIKKITQRREAGDSGRFSSKQYSGYQHIIEIAYSIDEPSYFKDKIARAKKNETRTLYTALFQLTSELQKKLSNGFTIFNSKYPLAIESLIKSLKRNNLFTDWDETLDYCLGQ
jgi:hypothetical protein